MKITREIPLSVIITHYSPADPGRISGPPEKCYPPEPAEISFTLLTRGGKTLDDSDFTAEEWEAIELEILETYEKTLSDDADEARIAAYLDYTEGF